MKNVDYLGVKFEDNYKDLKVNDYCGLKIQSSLQSRNLGVVEILKLKIIMVLKFKGYCGLALQ